MRIGSRVVYGALAAITLVAGIGILIQRHSIIQQSVDLTRENMTNIVLEGESVRNAIAELSTRKAFDWPGLKEELKQHTDYRDSVIFRTVPVIAAINSIRGVSEQQGYDFRVVRRRPRNPQNMPNASEAAILAYLDNPSSSEFFEVDRAAGLITYARPIILTQDCLSCHGDPATSPTGDGRDILGFPMEGWKAGERQGAFILTTNIERFNGAVRAGLKTTLIWTFLAALVIIGAFAYFNRRYIVRPIQGITTTIDQATDGNAAAAQELSQTSQLLAEIASQQAASLQETSASLEEMAGATQGLNDRAQSVASMSRVVSERADAGKQGMVTLSDAMGAIDHSSEEIKKVVRTIDEIAFQTNLLALNAAVEAARAGEAGAGFAVVAQDVRNLSARSAQAARETASLIEDACTRSRRGIESCDLVNRELEQIAQQAHALRQGVEELHRNCNEQARGIEEINTAVQALDDTTQRNAAASEQAASAAETLRGHAQSLFKAVNALLSLSSGQRSGPHHTATASHGAPRQASPSSFTVSHRTTEITAPSGPRLASPARRAASASEGSGFFDVETSKRS